MTFLRSAIAAFRAMTTRAPGVRPLVTRVTLTLKCYAMMP